jgi:hypothetical protein
MADFDDFFDALKDEIVDLAANHLEDLQDQAVEDTEQFLDDSKEDLKRWTRLLEEGAISKRDFESLVKGQKDLAKMEALKQAGLAAVEVDRFRKNLFDRITGVAQNFFL